MYHESSESEPLLTRKGDRNTERNTASSHSPCRDFANFLSLITVEPALFLYMLGLGFESVFLTNLWVDKVCQIHFNFSNETCANIRLGNHTAEQNAVQRMVNQYNVYNHIIQYLPAVVVVLLLGAWSDTKGRRLPILIPSFGLFLMMLSLLANSYWWTLPPEFLLISYAPVGCTGAVMGLLMASYSYVSAHSSRESRTLRVSIVSFTLVFGVTVGKGLAVYAYESGGYLAVFGTSSVLFVVGILYAMIRLEDRPGAPPEEGRRTAGVCEALSVSRLKKTVMVAVRSREGGQRSHILGHIIIILLLVSTLGTLNYDFLYARKRFSWDYKTFTLWSMINTPLAACGSLIFLGLLGYVYQMEDSMLGFIGTISILFNFVLRATAPRSWVLYLASVAGMCSGLPVVSSRSALSKLVADDEIGSVLGLLGALEAAIPVASATMFTAIYNATLEVFPGAIYAATAFISLIICCIYVWLLTKDIETPRTGDSNQIQA